MLLLDPLCFYLSFINETADLNPIENLWDVLEKALSSDPTFSSSLDLGEKIKPQIFGHRQNLNDSTSVYLGSRVKAPQPIYKECVTFFWSATV